MTRHAAQLLRLSATFQVADGRDLEALAELAAVLEMPTGTVLFRQGDPAASLYVVETGLLKVSRLSAGGRELTLGLSGPRQPVAGVVAFVEGAVYSADCTALEDSTVLVLPAAEVRQIVYRSPALAEAVLSHFARWHAEMLAHLETLLYSDLNARLAALLLAHVPPGRSFDLPTNSELAARLNTVPELVSRKLGEFYRQGFIGLQRRSLRILDEAALRRLAGRA